MLCTRHRWATFLRAVRSLFMLNAGTLCTVKARFTGQLLHILQGFEINLKMPFLTRSDSWPLLKKLYHHQATFYLL